MWEHILDRAFKQERTQHTQLCNAGRALGEPYISRTARSASVTEHSVRIEMTASTLASSTCVCAGQGQGRGERAAVGQVPTSVTTLLEGPVIASTHV